MALTISDVKNNFPSRHKEDIFHMGVLSPAFRRQRGSQNALLALAGGWVFVFCFGFFFNCLSFVVSLAQNNPLSKWHIWGQHIWVPFIVTGGPHLALGGFPRGSDIYDENPQG